MEQPGAQGIPVSVDLFANWDENVAAKKVKVVRQQQGFYQVLKRKFSEETGLPVAPFAFNIDREGAEELAKGLEASNAGLQKQIDANLKAIAGLRGPVIKAMDELDAQAKKEGDI